MNQNIEYEKFTQEIYQELSNARGITTNVEHNVGDVRTKILRQVITAAADGAMAFLNAERKSTKSAPLSVSTFCAFSIFSSSVYVS